MAIETGKNNRIRKLGAALLTTTALVGGSLAAMTIPVAAQVAVFDQTGNAGAGTFREAVGAVNADPAITTIYSLLTDPNTIVTVNSFILIDTPTPLLITGTEDFTLLSNFSGNVLQLNGGDDLTLDDVVTIRTTATFGNGIGVYGTANSVTLLEGSRIETSGITAHGITIGGSESRISVAGVIETGDSISRGISAAGDGNIFEVGASGSITTGGDHSTAIDIMADDNIVTISGAISTSGEEALGINVHGAGHTITLDDSGSIRTVGNRSSGIHINGDENEIDLSGRIDTFGAFNAHGIHVEGNDNTILASGFITADGGSEGIYTEGDGNLVRLLAGGSIITVDGNAIWMHGTNSYVEVAGDIHVGGDGNSGVRLGADMPGTDLNSDIIVSGTIRTGDALAGTGDFAHGIEAEGNYVYITQASGGLIETVGANAHGIMLEGDNSEIDLSGTVRTVGASSQGLSLTGADNAFSLTGSGEILTAGAGIIAYGNDNTFDISGTIDAGEVGLSAFGSNVAVDVGGTVIATGPIALGVGVSGDDALITVSGGITANGTDPLSSAVIIDTTTAGRLELRPGFSLSATAGTLASAQNSGDVTLTLGGAGAESFDISQIGAATGYVGFADFDKRGASTWTLTGMNNVVDWTVREGTMLVSGDAGGMDVLSGATLGGTGSVGDTTIAGGGHLVGIQGQTLTLASLELDSGSIIDVSLGVPGTTALFDVTTDLTLDGTLNISDVGGFGPGLYRLFDYGGSLDDQGLDIGTVPGGIDAADLAVQTAIAQQVNLYYDAGGGGGGDFLFWDGDLAGSPANGVIDGGDGQWNRTNTNWTNVDGSANGAMSPVPGFAVFAGTGGFVQADSGDGPLSVTGMQFATHAYVIQGDAIELAGVGGDAIIRVGDGTVAGAAYGARIESELTGAARLVKNDLGTLILTGPNTYAGGTLINAGVLQVSSDGNLGLASGGLTFNGGTLATTASFDSARDVTLLADGRFDVATGTALGLNGAISGSGDLIKQGSGMLLLEGSNAYGDTIVEEGTLAGHSASISGNIANAGAVIFVQATDATFAGNIVGLGGTDGIMIKDGSGVLTLTGTSGLDWSIGAGSIVTAAERFTGDATLVTGGELVFDQAADAVSGILLSGDGTGTFAKAGGGLLTLTGTNGGFTGHTNIDGGTLLVTDALGGTLDINAGGVLAGNGTVGTTTVRTGGTISPGTAGQIDTLHVAGDLTFEAGSTYVVHVEAPDQSDLIAVTGTATIDGGAVQVEKLSAEASYMDGQTYRLLTASSLVDNAEFTLNQPFLFLDAELIYGSTFVDLTLARSASFADTALTFNQFQTATALDGLKQSGDALGVFNELLVMSDADEARRAFDLSSGEIHASGQHVINQTFQLFSRTLRQQAAAGVGNGTVGTEVYSTPMGIASAYGPASPTGAGVLAIDGATAAYADARVRGAWAAPLGARGTVDSDGNAGALDWWTLGLAGGYEGAVDVGSGDAVAGFAFGYLRSGGRVDARLSSMDADGFHLGAYGAWADGPWSLAGSAAYAASHVSTQRRIIFGGIDRTAEASYWNHTVGLSTELAYAIETNSGFTISPLFTLDAGWSGHGGYSESGAGALGLTAAGQGYGWLDTGLGIALAHTIETEHGKVTFDGRAIWEHAFAGAVPGADHLLTGSPVGFTVNGPDAGNDRLRVGAGLAFEIGDDLTIRARYDGLFSGSQQSHAGSVGINVKF